MQVYYPNRTELDFIVRFSSENCFHKKLFLSIKPVRSGSKPVQNRSEPNFCPESPFLPLALPSLSLWPTVAPYSSSQHHLFFCYICFSLISSRITTISHGDGNLVSLKLTFVIDRNNQRRRWNNQRFWRE